VDGRVAACPPAGEADPVGPAMTQLLVMPQSFHASAVGLRIRSRFRRYPLPDGIRQLQRLVVIGDEAWPVDRVRKAGKIEAGDLVLTWVPGQNSLHDSRRISEGRDVGNIIVQKREGGELKDIAYDITFAFAFAAFRPDGKMHVNREIYSR